MTRSLPDLERISRRIDMAGGPDACWEWQGSRHQRGYGLTQWTIDGKRRTTCAHRAFYQLVNGVRLSTEEYLLHQCDNPPCCNPAHLRPGTAYENMQDRKHRGAGYPRGGETYNALQISDETVAKIRAEYRRGSREYGARGLAEKYGISVAAMAQIVARRGRWRDAEVGFDWHIG